MNPGDMAIVCPGGLLWRGIENMIDRGGMTYNLTKGHEAATSEWVTCLVIARLRDRYGSNEAPLLVILSPGKLLWVRSKYVTELE